MDDISTLHPLHPMYICSYISYFQKLFEGKMKYSTFMKTIESDQKEKPKTFLIKCDNVYQAKLIDDLDTFLMLFKHLNNKSSIIESFKDKFGIIARVYISRELSANNKEIQEFSNWIDLNTSFGFLLRFNFSSFLPYIFLDIQTTDSILSVGTNFPEICEIISYSLKDGYIFINETDIKQAKNNYNFDHDNYCVISYPINEIPKIEEFDKVLCIAPSTKDGSIFNQTKDVSIFSLDQAIINHQEQKKYLINSLNKVKVGGLCVYATFSMNPFENEAVINSVLQMPEFEGNFELVDCSTQFKEIRRKNGIKTWESDIIMKNIEDEYLKKSLSGNSTIEDIEKCMRFYPHQIDCCGTFIAVIKKKCEIIQKNSQKKHTKKKKTLYFEIPQKIKEMIYEEFGITEYNENLQSQFKFVINNDDINGENIYRVNTKLFNVINQYGFNNINIFHIGCLGFSYINEDFDFKYIPSVSNLPSSLLLHAKHNIIIGFDDFKYIIEFKQISIDQLKTKKNQILCQQKQQSGVCINLEGYGPLIGGYLKDGYLIIIENKDSLNRFYKIVKESLPASSFKKQINYFNKCINENEKQIVCFKKRIDENEKEFQEIKNYQKETTKELKQMLNTEINTFDKEYSKNIVSLTNHVTSLRKMFEIEIQNLNNEINEMNKKMDEEIQRLKKENIKNFESLTNQILPFKKIYSCRFSSYSDPNGIISFLKYLVTLTAFGEQENGNTVENIRFYDASCFFNFDGLIPNAESESFILFDFGTKRIDLYSYFIRSGYNDPNYWHPKTWRIEGSNNKSNWICLDRRENDNNLNGKYLQCHYECQGISHGKEQNQFRYIRYIQEESWYICGRYDFCISYFELYGDVFNY